LSVKLRSRELTDGRERAAHRALLYALGLTKAEISQPFVGVANSWTELVPGHMHLRSIGDSVKAGIRMEVGTPFEFNTIAICDGMCQGHVGMRYSLPSREISRLDRAHGRGSPPGRARPDSRLRQDRSRSSNGSCTTEYSLNSCHSGADDAREARWKKPHDDRHQGTRRRSLDQNNLR
jgi:hypothetical protein